MIPVRVYSTTSHQSHTCHYRSDRNLTTRCSSYMMPFPSALPPTLIDLTILRLTGALSSKSSASAFSPFLFGNKSAFRRIHQVAALTSTNDSKIEPFTEGSLSSEPTGRYALFAFSFVTCLYIQDKV